jgi:ParB-like chromosome segregation protein Spo0J
MARTKITLSSEIPATESLNLREGQSEIPIANILPRPEGDFRPLDAGHVVTLAESMTLLGLLEPIVVDLEGHLLAGAHRLAALQLLAISDGEERRKAYIGRIQGLAAIKVPKKSKGAEGADEAAGEAEDTAPKLSATVESFAKRIADLDNALVIAKYSAKLKIPVMAVDTSEKAGKALDLVVETTENGIRRQYSNDEINGLAVKLKKAGYTHRDGRPRQGEKAMIVVLESIVGKTTKHLKRILGEKHTKEAKPEWERSLKALERVMERVLDAGKEKRTKLAGVVKEHLKAVQEAMATAAGDEDGSK